MENPCESNSSLTKPSRDNIQCSSIMQLRLASSYYMTLQPNLFLLNLQGFENKKITAFDCFHKLWWVTFFCFALSMIVLVISCTFDLYCKLYYEIELVSYELNPIKLLKKKPKNQKHGGKCKQFFNILCITAQRYACHCKYDLHYIRRYFTLNSN